MERRTHGGIVWPLAVAAALRLLAVALLAADIPVVGDSNGYVYLGQFIREHGHSTEITQEGVRPPLYPYLVAAGLDMEAVPPSPFPWVFVLQVLADLGTLLLVSDVARRRFGPRVALATAWIFALLPAAVLYPALLVLTEPVAGCATALALWCLQRLDEARAGQGRGLAGWSCTTGLVLGAGLLTKESGLMVAAAVLGALLLAWRGVPLARRLPCATLVLAAAVLPLLPWCVHTQRTYGVVIPTGTYAQLSLVFDNMPPGESFEELWTLRPTYAERMAGAQAAFRRTLVEHTGLFLRRAWWRLRVFVGPELLLPTLVALAHGEYRPPPDESINGLYAQTWRLAGPWGGSVQTIATLGALLFFVLAAAGLARRPDGVLAASSLLMLAGLLLSMALMVGQDRYRYALLAPLAPFAGLGLVAGLRAGAASEGSRGRVLAVALVVGLTLATTMLVLPMPWKPDH